jgi:hypothetical protein
MIPRNRSLIALGLVAIAAFSALFHHLNHIPSPAINPGTIPSQPQHTPAKHDGTSTKPANELETNPASAALAQEAKQKQLALWSKNASAGLALSLNNLIADLPLSTEETAALTQIFARRDAELTSLLSAMLSGNATNDSQLFTSICALLRNKGLRQDLAGVLSASNLAAFDSNEANRQHQSIEARAYRDMADINSVVLLSDSQKQQALAALIRQAPEKVEHEADTRAFLTLHYGQSLTDIDPASIRGLTTLANQLSSNPHATLDIDSPQFRQSSATTKADRIARDLSTLQNILDEQQLARYREHLESEPAW